jgi:hypothetical protein
MTTGSSKKLERDINTRVRSEKREGPNQIVAHSKKKGRLYLEPPPYNSESLS